MCLTQEGRSTATVLTNRSSLDRPRPGCLLQKPVVYLTKQELKTIQMLFVRNFEASRWDVTSNCFRLTEIGHDIRRIDFIYDRKCSDIHYNRKKRLLV